MALLSRESAALATAVKNAPTRKKVSFLPCQQGSLYKRSRAHYYWLSERVAITFFFFLPFPSAKSNNGQLGSQAAAFVFPDRHWL